MKPSVLLFRFRDDSLFRNSVYMIGVTIATSALGFAYWAIAARTFSATAVGLAATMISVMMAASAIGNFGIYSALVQLLPGQGPGREWSLTVNAALLCVFVGGAVVGVLTLVILPLLSSELDPLTGDAFYGFLFAAGVALTALAIVIDYVSVAERSSGRMLLRNLVFAIVKIPVLLVPVVVGMGALGILFSWVASLTMSLVLGFVLVRSLGRGWTAVFRGIIGRGRSMIGSFLGHHVINVGNVAPGLLLPLLATARLSPAEAAYLFAAWSIAGLFFMVAPAVATSLFAEGSHRTDGLRYQTRSAARLIAALLAPLVLGAALGGGVLLGIFGPDYAEHGRGLLLVLAVASVPDAITNVYVSVLRVRERLRPAGALTVGMAVMTVVLAWVLLPPMGIVGAGLAFLVARVGGALVIVGAHWSANRSIAADSPAAAEEQWILSQRVG